MEWQYALCVRPGGLPHGPSSVYRDGVRGDGMYRDGVAVGTWRYVNRRGALLATEDAPSSTGVATWWHENGQVEWRGALRGGRRQGVWRYWRADGTLDMTETYDNGRVVARWGEHFVSDIDSRDHCPEPDGDAGHRVVDDEDCPVDRDGDAPHDAAADVRLSAGLARISPAGLACRRRRR